jgi:hypothetical protein
MKNRLHKRKRKGISDREFDDDRYRVRLAEHSAPQEEEWPLCEPTCELPAPADAWHDLRPERGRLH